MTLSKDYYQEVQEAVRESGDAFMVHNPRLALRKALQAAIELNQLVKTERLKATRLLRCGRRWNRSKTMADRSRIAY
jgi:hypothetical protein